MIESSDVNTHIRKLYAEGVRDSHDIEAALSNKERAVIDYEGRLLYITNETRAPRYESSGGSGAFVPPVEPAAAPRIPVPQPEPCIVVGGHGRQYKNTFKVFHFHALREIYGRNETKQDKAATFIRVVEPALAGADNEALAFPLMEKKLGRRQAGQLFDEFPGLTEQAGSLD